MLKALVSTVFAVSLAVSGAAQTTKAGSGLDTARIEQLTGAKGKLDEKEGAFKVSVPRTDLAVTAAGVRLTPPLGLTSWASFQRAGAGLREMKTIVASGSFLCTVATKSLKSLNTCSTDLPA